MTTSTSTPELGLRQHGESVVITVHEPTTTEAQQEHLPELEELQPPPSYDEVHDPNGEFVSYKVEVNPSVLIIFWFSIQFSQLPLHHMILYSVGSVRSGKRRGDS